MCALASGRKVPRETAIILSLGYNISLASRVNFFLMPPHGKQTHQNLLDHFADLQCSYILSL